LANIQSLANTIYPLIDLNAGEGLIVSQHIRQ
jgi:hypothetical protein